MEMQEEDQPPEEIWLDQGAMEAHWESVKARWRAKAGGEEPTDDRPMMDNELAREWRHAK